MKKHSQHLPHYLPLVGVLLFCLFGFLIFSYDRAFQVILTVLMGVFYVVWGVMHHHTKNDLYLVVVLEYASVAILGVLIVLSLILNT